MTDKEIIDGLYEIKNWKCNGDSKMHSIIRGAIDLLEQTRWIPISEGLPKNTGWYFITFKTANGVAVCELSYRKPENYWTDKDISKKVLDNNDVIAWMPKPQPYKTEEEQNARI